MQINNKNKSSFVSRLGQLGGLGLKLTPLALAMNPSSNGQTSQAKESILPDYETATKDRGRAPAYFSRLERLKKPAQAICLDSAGQTSQTSNSSLPDYQTATKDSKLLGQPRRESILPDYDTAIKDLSQECQSRLVENYNESTYVSGLEEPDSLVLPIRPVSAGQVSRTCSSSQPAVNRSKLEGQPHRGENNYKSTNVSGLGEKPAQAIRRNSGLPDYQTAIKYYKLLGQPHRGSPLSQSKSDGSLHGRIEDSNDNALLLPISSLSKPILGWPRLVVNKNTSLRKRVLIMNFEKTIRKHNSNIRLKLPRETNLDIFSGRMDGRRKLRRKRKILSDSDMLNRSFTDPTSDTPVVSLSANTSSRELSTIPKVLTLNASSASSSSSVWSTIDQVATLNVPSHKADSASSELSTIDQTGCQTNPKRRFKFAKSVKEGAGTISAGLKNLNVKKGAGIISDGLMNLRLV